MKSNLSEMLMDYIFFWSQMRPGQKETKRLSLRKKWGQISGSSSRLIFENKKINNKKILSLPNILMCLFYESAVKFHSMQLFVCEEWQIAAVRNSYVFNARRVMNDEWMNTKLVQSIYCLLTQVHPNLTFENIHCLNCIHFRNNKAQLNENVAL